MRACEKVCEWSKYCVDGMGMGEKCLCVEGGKCVCGRGKCLSVRVCVSLMWVSDFCIRECVWVCARVSLWEDFLSAQAAITKCHSLSTLNRWYLLPHRFGGWKFEVKVSAGLASPEASLLGL